MKEQLITFETAKLAKEKGLQLGCKISYCHYHSKYVYDGDPNHPESHKKNEIVLDRDFYTVNNYKGIDISNERYTIYEAPTQSLLQKWLREKYSIEVIAEPTYKSDLTKKYTVCYYFKGVKFRIKEEDKSFDTIFKYFITHEEALEKGLQEGLKLI